MRKGIVIVLVAMLCLIPAGCGEKDYSGGIVQKRTSLGKTVSSMETTEVSADNTTDGVSGDTEGGDSSATADYSTKVASDDTIYILQNVDLEKKIVTLVNSVNGRVRSFQYNLQTSFSDKYGERKSIESFEVGYPVHADINEALGSISALSITGDAWFYSGVVKYSIDMENSTMTIADSKYYFDDILTCYSEGYVVPLDLIGNNDTLSVVGVDKRIISMIVTSGHGFISLTNTSLFDGSYICIGSTIFKEVEPGFRMEIPEGSYLVTVANDGWGSSQEISIIRGQEYVLDLDTMKGEGPKYCSLSFDLGGIETAKIEIDGEEIDTNEPTEVRYGTHKLKISADGYDTLEKKLVVNSDEATIELGLTESSSSDSSSSSSTSSNTASSTTSSAGTTSGTGTTNTTGTTTGTGTSNTTGTGTTNSSTTASDSTSSSSSTDTSSKDYLTTLYNLLTALNNSEDN
ncbi:MAG: hypothetical protein K6F37_07685 [Lachnospiraceae bacterium]|nr:hypothetical protein [Lachnospiraceae bacterium]